MNDPHVKAIHYFIEHDDSVNYGDAEALVHEDEFFCVRADKAKLPSGLRFLRRAARSA